MRFGKMGFGITGILFIGRYIHLEDKDKVKKTNGTVKASKAMVSKASIGGERRTTDGSKTPSGSRPSGGSRPASGSRPSGGSRPASGSRPSDGSRPAGGSRPSGGGKAAKSRPKSATEQERSRTSTGRPLAGSADTRSRTKDSTRHAPKSNKSGASSADLHRKKKKQTPRLNAKRVLFAALIVGIFLSVIVTVIMRANMLKVKQIETKYNIGDSFDISNYFEADSNDAKLIFDNDSFNPTELGEYTLKFTVQRGKLKMTKKGTINVVDEVNPYIEGPDDIDVAVGQEINWGDYFNVTDNDPDIQSKLKPVKEVDTSTARPVSVTLTVTDWAGNSSLKKITVNVLKDNFSE